MRWAKGLTLFGLLLALLLSFGLAAQVSKGLELTVSPKSADVGTAAEITLKNTGTEPITVKELSVKRPSGSIDTIASDISLSPGGSKTYRYTNVGQAGTYTVKAVFDSAELTETFERTSPPPPRLGLSTGSIDFGSVRVNSSRTKSFTIYNRGGSPLSGRISCDGWDCDAFSYPSSFSGISPGSSKTIDVKFSPSAPGSYSATLRIRSNGGSGSIDLEGYGEGYCGDGYCSGDEDCSSCPSDCGTCPYCGDGICQWDESCSSCPEDCGTCPPPSKPEPIMPGEALLFQRPSNPLVTLPEVQDARIIQQLINQAQPGQIISIPEGIYVGSLIINGKKGLTIDGNGALLIGEDGKPTLKIKNSDNITVRNFSITLGFEGVVIVDSSSVTLEEDTIERSSWIGINIWDSEVNLFRNVITDNGGRAIVIVEDSVIGDSPKVTLRENLFARNRILGLIVFGSGVDKTEIVIEKNRFIDNLPSLKPIWGRTWGRAIEIHRAKALIADNIIRNQPDVGLLLFEAKAEILNNEITHTEGDFGRGVELQHSQAVVQGNLIAHNEEIGLALFDSKVKLLGNEIRDNGLNIFIDAESAIEE